jgi:hypothetical protein
MRKKIEPKILSEEKTDLIRQAGLKIAEIRNELYKHTEIDILSTDNMKSIAVEDIIKNYDGDFRTNWRRNGVDAISGQDQIEIKNCSIEKPDVPKISGPNKGDERTGAWQFHALHNDDHYERFVGVIWDKKTSKVKRIYDIKKAENIQRIKGDLDRKTKDFLAQVENKGKDVTRDVITLDENFVKSFDNLTENVIDGVIVRKDW